MVTFANLGSVRLPSLKLYQLYIYNSFPVIRTTIAKKIVIFTYPGLHFFVCHGDAPVAITQNVA